MFINRPVAFKGSEAQKRINYSTHVFVPESMDPDCFDYRCAGCDCKPWHAAAYYPCGTEPPRENAWINTEKVDQ